jgi:hypothetical protein
MHGFLFLGDSVTQHADGTISVARGGISRLQAPKDKPAVVSAGLFARVKAPQGPHKLRIDFEMPVGAAPPLDVAGKPFPTSFPLDVQMEEQASAVHVVAQFHIAFIARGKYTFKLVVDEQVLDTWELVVEDRVPLAVPAAVAPTEASHT